jgi:23S rRNA (cytidine2498-2'-O)-methyltransferase
MTQRDQIIAVVQEGFEAVAKRYLEPQVRGLMVVAPGILRGTTSDTPRQLLEELKAGLCPWVRYAFQLFYEAALQGGAFDERQLFAAIEKVAMELPGQAFSVHVMQSISEGGEGALSSDAIKSLRSRIASQLAGQGKTILRRGSDATCCLLCAGGQLFVGGFVVQGAISSWPLGAIRIRRDEEEISRAERKLIEAIEQFEIQISTQTKALDLGAAPGGWTRVLCSRGAQVTAVDPADLDSRLMGSSNLTFVRQNAEDFVLGLNRKDVPDGQWNLVVNDMRADPIWSAAIMQSLAPYMQPQAVIVMTVKLADGDPRAIRDTLERVKRLLERSYIITGVKQLFHNRSECTLVGRSRSQCV